MIAVHWPKCNWVNNQPYQFTISSSACYHVTPPKTSHFLLTAWAFSYEKQEHNTLHDFKKNLKILLCHAVVVLKRYEILFAHQNRDPFEKWIHWKRGEKKSLNKRCQYHERDCGITSFSNLFQQRNCKI